MRRMLVSEEEDGGDLEKREWMEMMNGERHTAFIRCTG
jgi:hypothetical protein